MGDRRPTLRPEVKDYPVAPGEEPNRLQKVLAHAGVGSRRTCEEFILQGRVSVNGQIVRELGTKVVHGRDRVALDGQTIHGDERPAYIAVNKPKGYVSTNADPSGRPRVVDLVPDIPQRVYTVGRLDEMSTGLLLLTNDGELANKLAHPRFGVEKVYRAVVAGMPSPEVFQKLIEGVWLAEGKVRAKRVKPIARKGDSTVLELVLAEGKNREVRRMLAKFGHKVMTLTRVAVGPVTLKGLKPGGWRFLTAREVDLLRRVAAGLPVPTTRYTNEHARPLRPPTRGPRAPGRVDQDILPRAGDRRPMGRDRSEDQRPERRPARPNAPQARDRRTGGPDENRPNRHPGVPPSQRPGFISGPQRGPGEGGPGPRRPALDANRRPLPQRGSASTPPRPALRPQRIQEPTRKIIGLNLFDGGGGGSSSNDNESVDRRPAPRKRPGPSAPANRPRPTKFRRRPGDDN